jgi:hypothetical protein
LQHHRFGGSGDRGVSAEDNDAKQTQPNVHE